MRPDAKISSSLAMFLGTYVLGSFNWWKEEISSSASLVESFGTLISYDEALSFSTASVVVFYCKSVFVFKFLQLSCMTLRSS